MLKSWHESFDVFESLYMMSTWMCVCCVLSRCGLVALWMAAHLQRPPMSVDMETVVQTALSRGYTAQGEMFSGNSHVEVIEGNQE